MPKELTIRLSEKIKTTKVMYADAPLRLDGVHKEITLDELYHKVKPSFVYSDALFSKGKHVPFLEKEFKPVVPSSKYFLKKFEQHGFTDISSLVICNMGSLGHGVFAGKDFEPGECFILYSGIINEDVHSESYSLYAFAYGKGTDLFVDAAEIGNISRFIQHMPLNFNLLSQQERDKLECDEKQLPGNKESSEYWQWRNIKYKSGLTEDEVAWANLSMMVILLNGVPSIICYNESKIKQGDQLGISYGNGYWRRRGLKPELFDLKGSVIPETKYGYKGVVVDLPPMELFNQFPQFQKICITRTYNALMFQKDLQRKQEAMQPVWFNHLAEPVSIFRLRELLLQYGVLEKEYEPIEDEFVAGLRDVLPTDFKIKMFERDPHQQSIKPIYDVICTTDDLMKWSQLTALLKGPQFAETTIQSKCLKFTQEIIIMDIGSNSVNQKYLLAIFMKAKMYGFFMDPLPEELIPSGPTRGNRRGIFMTSSKECIDQILLHNPGLTKEEIDDAYKLAKGGFNSNINIMAKLDSLIGNDNETKLNTVTSSFFKTGAPAKWKVYPAERLTGKYIGHQVRFFNIPTEHSVQAKPFANILKQNGFEAELTKAKDKHSIVVDLTRSKFTL